VTRGQLRGSFWPSPRQLLILRVITADDAAAADAWKQLRSRLELERLELGSFELMPLMYRRLEEIAPDDPVLAKLAGIYRKTWYTNQIELKGVASALATLVEADTDPLVIDGWELVFRYYGDRGVRAVAGLQIIVPPASASAAGRALLDAGWQADLTPGAPAIRLVRDGTTCVLHRELFHEFPRAARTTAALWDTAVPLRVEGVDAAMLGPADEFLHVCLNGARARSWPSVRWLADAVRVAGSGNVDWDRVVRQARLFGATLRLHVALTYLRDSLSCAAPPSVFSELEPLRAGRRERLAHALSASDGVLGPAPESLSRYLRATADQSAFESIRRLPSFLRDEWGLRRRRSVPAVAAAKAARRMLAAIAQRGRPARRIRA